MIMYASKRAKWLSGQSASVVDESVDVSELGCFHTWFDAWSVLEPSLIQSLL